MPAQLSHFYLNGQIRPIDAFNDALITGKTSVYEVIKVINSRPVFLKQHLQRLAQSLEQAGYSTEWAQPVGAAIANLLGQCPVERHNIRVAIVFDDDTAPRSTAVYFIPSTYPTAEQYSQGVAVDLLPAERSNPTAKVEQSSLRQRANEAMAQHNLYEVLLLNRHNQITEGSRSNVFMVHANGHLITAPNETVLGGITRDVVLSICQQLGVAVELRCPHSDELPQMQAMFITGTSPCVLPISRCGNLTFVPNHPLVRQIAQRYAEAEAEDIDIHITHK